MWDLRESEYSGTLLSQAALVSQTVCCETNQFDKFYQEYSAVRVLVQLEA